MKKFWIILICICLTGCAVKATRTGSTLKLEGWGARSAEWPDGAKIAKEEPIKVPDIMPVSR